MKMYFIFLSVLTILFCEGLGGKIPRTAIIGGGIGGTSTAYFLKELFGGNEMVELYEPNDIGGRLATVTINNEEYEIGGSIVHSKNHYMNEFVEKFGLTKITDSTDEKLGIYNGEFLFVESSMKWLTYLKLLWRYGFGVLDLEAKVNKLLTEFERIYDLQEDGKAFKTVRDLLDAISANFPGFLNVSTFDGFLRDGIPENVINEIINTAIRCNYGQTTKIHKLVGAVAVTAAGNDLWSVEGGNKRVPEKLLKASNALHHTEKVLKIKLTESDQYLVSSNVSNRTYDVVILATPLTEDQREIIFENFDDEIRVPGVYHHTVCSFIKGTINNTYFGFKHLDEVPKIILTASENVFFYSMVQILPSKKQVAFSQQSEKEYPSRKLWKISSPKALSKKELSNLFIDYEIVYMKDWFAYPEYSIGGRKDTFVLHKNLFYVNAIEWVSSSMETSVIGAKNVALLMYSKWAEKKKVDKVKKKVEHEEL